MNNVLDSFHSIIFTHRNLSVDEIGALHISEEMQSDRLNAIKQRFGLPELMFLSTCNRVEFQLCTDEHVDEQFLNDFFQTLYPALEKESISHLLRSSEVFSGIQAVKHLLRVASSIDSMVVGEREIITQVRNAYELSKANGLTGDFIRLLIRHTIETAKQVYTETNIARKPVSIVSLAYHRLRQLNIPLNARILIIGAGVTNTNMSRFLKKHGFTNFVVFNRTLSKAERLAADLNGRALPLSELSKYKEGFDVIITCTGSESHIISPELYESLLIGEIDKKVVIDIAIPQDLSPEITEKHKVNHISVNLLQQISNDNLKERSKEVQHVETILDEKVEDFKQLHRLRTVELAMREVPQKVKDIKSTALNQVFKSDVDSLDEQSKEVLAKVIDYMEKKYMSMPMLMAKEILLKNN
jgi:glutamyl-tRNA reductase